MSGCYDRIGSKTQKSDESPLAKLKDQLTKKNKSSKNKSGTADEVIDVDSDENNSIGIGGFFGDSEDEEFEEPKEEKKMT